jgi:hypothetical protein
MTHFKTKYPNLMSEKMCHQFFLLFSGKTNANSFFSTCHVSMGINDHLEPARHAVSQLFQVISAELHGPQLLDGGDELGHRQDILFLNEVLHMVLTIFNLIQVRAVSRPIYDLERLLSQESLDPLGGMAQEKSVCSMLLHEPEQEVLQHSLVEFAVHCDVFWKKEKATMPQSSRKTPPNHNTVRVFYSFDGVEALKPVAVLWSPHFVPG